MCENSTSTLSLTFRAIFQAVSSLVRVRPPRLYCEYKIERPLYLWNWLRLYGLQSAQFETFLRVISFQSWSWSNCAVFLPVLWRIIPVQNAPVHVLRSGTRDTWWLGAPLGPKISSKSCSFQAILRKKNPILSKFWAQGLPLGSKFRWAPMTKILDPRLVLQDIFCRQSSVPVCMSEGLRLLVNKHLLLLLTLLLDYRLRNKSFAFRPTNRGRVLRWVDSVHVIRFDQSATQKRRDQPAKKMCISYFHNNRIN